MLTYTRCTEFIIASNALKMFDSACFIPLFVFPFLSGNKLTDWANVCATLRNFLYIYFVHFCLFGICYGITNIADVLKKNLTEKV